MVSLTLFNFCLVKSIVSEGHTDRHNMLVFLMQDTLRTDPVGFEKRRRNLFDPEDDEDDQEEDTSNAEVLSGSEDEPENKKPTVLAITEQKSRNNLEDSDKGANKDACAICAKKGCSKLSRFDSIFCSDACGVSVLESDLLRTFFYSSDIHPSSLRH